MSATVAESVEKVLAEHVRPALSSHAGSIRLTSVDGESVHLDLVGSCSGCYFRRACVTGVVRPALQEHMGQQLTYVVDNARV